MEMFFYLAQSRFRLGIPNNIFHLYFYMQGSLTPSLPDNAAKFTCSANEVFTHKSKTCTCDGSGKFGRCSKKCGDNIAQRWSHFEPDDNSTSPQPPLREVTIQEVIEGTFTCKPSEVFKLECNTCWCKTKGNEIRDCTRIACNPKEYSPLS
jgi:hypothetical protein